MYFLNMMRRLVSIFSSTTYNGNALSDLEAVKKDAAEKHSDYRDSLSVLMRDIDSMAEDYGTSNVVSIPVREGILL